MINNITPCQLSMKKELMDIKLSLILSDFEFIPNLKAIKNRNIFTNYKHWSVIQKYKGNSIITGSVALKAFGLMQHRETKDLDLIVIDDSFKNYYKDKNPRYFGTDNKEIKGYFFENSITIDLFENNSVTVIEKDGYLFQNPIEIIENKIAVYTHRYKDNIDIKKFFKIMSNNLKNRNRRN